MYDISSGQAYTAVNIGNFWQINSGKSLIADDANDISQWCDWQMPVINAAATSWSRWPDGSVGMKMLAYRQHSTDSFHRRKWRQSERAQHWLSENRTKMRFHKTPWLTVKYGFTNKFRFGSVRFKKNRNRTEILVTADHYYTLFSKTSFRYLQSKRRTVYFEVGIKLSGDWGNGQHASC